MKCSQCNSELLDSDTFCPICGAKVVKAGRCPHCGAALRPGARFCQSCGKSVNDVVFTSDPEEPPEEETEELSAPEEISDREIPLEEVEKNIILEAAHSVIKRDRETGDGRRETAPSDRERPDFDEERHHSRGRRSADRRYDRMDDREVHRKRKTREMREREDYEYDDEDDDGTDRGLRIAMIIVGAAIVCAFLILIFGEVRDKRNSDMAATETETSGDMENGVPMQAGPGISGDASGPKVLGTVMIVKDVRVRATPSTDEDNILGTVSAGEKFDFLGYSENRNWVHVYFTVDGNPVEGYISSGYVQVQENTDGGSK
ncbi:MAG: zinc-ribbon domain-containing protein [Lachnospiraceae bacterium]|nr:zinc-ribbon domain-containing protein [Lachnospiraceae bacterium]